MNYIPKGYLSKKHFDHLIVPIMGQELSTNIWVMKTTLKGNKDKVFPKKGYVDLAYVKNCEVYVNNLEAIKNYISELYFVISHYLNDVEIATIMNAIFPTSVQSWNVWVADRLLQTETFGEKHLQAIKVFKYILQSPRLRQKRNYKFERWFEEKRINLSETENVFLKELKGVA